MAPSIPHPSPVAVVVSLVLAALAATFGVQSSTFDPRAFVFAFVVYLVVITVATELWQLVQSWRDSTGPR
jgi:ABC-type arginine/histidine transport system permease subunit